MLKQKISWGIISRKRSKSFGVNSRPDSSAAFSGAPREGSTCAAMRGLDVRRQGLVVTRTPHLARTKSSNGSFVHLPTNTSSDTKLATSLELTKLSEAWRKLLRKSDYAGARAFIVASVRRMCNTLARQVEDREALALKKKARDVAAQALKK